MNDVGHYARLFSCDGRVALVTGADGLLGREACAALSAAGADVWSADVRVDPTGSRSIALDITSEESVNRSLDVVTETSGRLDILVNCAYPRTADWGTSIDHEEYSSWTANLDAQLGGCFLVSRAAAERMVGSGGGSIVNLASIYGMVGPSWEVYEGTSMTMPSAYAAIKGGIINLTRLLATYYGPRGVRCNCVSPGGVFDRQPARFREQYEALTPLRRMANPSDLAGAVVFLASEASSYVTGHNLVVDGGWTAR